MEENANITPPAKISKRNRRYYLHAKIKKFMRIDVGARTLYYNEEVLDNLSAKQLQYFLELQMKFNYAAQLEI
jgi:hypothetical protein